MPKEKLITQSQFDEEIAKLLDDKEKSKSYKILQLLEKARKSYLQIDTKAVVAYFSRADVTGTIFDSEIIHTLKTFSLCGVRAAEIARLPFLSKALARISDLSKRNQIDEEYVKSAINILVHARNIGLLESVDPEQLRLIFNNFAKYLKTSKLEKEEKISDTNFNSLLGICLYCDKVLAMEIPRELIVEVDKIEIAIDENPSQLQKDIFKKIVETFEVDGWKAQLSDVEFLEEYTFGEYIKMRHEGLYGEVGIKKTKSGDIVIYFKDKVIGIIEVDGPSHNVRRADGSVAIDGATFARNEVAKKICKENCFVTISNEDLKLIENGDKEAVRRLQSMLEPIKTELLLRSEIEKNRLEKKTKGKSPSPLLNAKSPSPTGSKASTGSAKSFRAIEADIDEDDGGGDDDSEAKGEEDQLSAAASRAASALARMTPKIVDVNLLTLKKFIDEKNVEDLENFLRTLGDEEIKRLNNDAVQFKTELVEENEASPLKYAISDNPSVDAALTMMIFGFSRIAEQKKAKKSKSTGHRDDDQLLKLLGTLIASHPAKFPNLAPLFEQQPYTAAKIKERLNKKYTASELKKLSRDGNFIKFVCLFGEKALAKTFLKRALRDCQADALRIILDSKIFTLAEAREIAELEREEELAEKIAPFLENAIFEGNNEFVKAVVEELKINTSHRFQVFVDVPYQYTPLYMASFLGNNEAFEILFKANPDLSYEPEKDKPFLCVNAIEKDNLELVKFLMRHIRPNIMEYHEELGSTFFQLAVEKDALNVVRYFFKLMPKAREFKFQDWEGEMSLIFSAIINGASLEMVELLFTPKDLQQRFNGRNLLLTALKSSQEKTGEDFDEKKYARGVGVATFLIEKFNESGKLEERGPDGRDALLTAAGYGLEDAALRLIQLGVNINTVDNKGYSALMLAADHGDLILMDVLCKMNPSQLDYKTADELYTATTTAASSLCYDGVDFLIKRGANFQCFSKWGISPLDGAAMRGDNINESLMREVVDLMWDKFSESQKINAAIISFLRGNTCFMKYLIEKEKKIPIMPAAEVESFQERLGRILNSPDNFQIFCQYQKNSKLTPEDKRNFNLFLNVQGNKITPEIKAKIAEVMAQSNVPVSEMSAGGATGLVPAANNHNRNPST